MQTEVRTLRQVKFTTTGDHVFYVNDAEYKLLRRDPHVIPVDEYYNRPSATITDLEFLQVVAKLREPHPNGGGYYWVMVSPVALEFDINPNRIRSKMRRMYKRKLIDGCNCGCRGDISILPLGEKMLLENNAN